VLVFFLDSALPVSSIAMLPVDLSVFQSCSVHNAAEASVADTEDVAAGVANLGEGMDSDGEHNQPEKTRFVGRRPFSFPPVALPPPASRSGEPPPVDHKSYMLMVGYHQVASIVPCCRRRRRRRRRRTDATVTRVQPDTHLRLVRVCPPASAAAFHCASHSHAVQCCSDVTKRLYRRMVIATHETNNTSFAAAIFQAAMCRCVAADHPNVKSLFSILAESTRKVRTVKCGTCVL
jgi:hypothetical protein